MQHRQLPSAQRFCSIKAPARISLQTVRLCQAYATDCARHPENVMYRMRRAKVEDSQAVADLYSEVFGGGNFPGFEDNPVMQQVEANYAAAMGRESSDKLAEALTSKAQAALAHRMYRVTQQAAMLKGELRMAQGLPAVFPTEGPAELRQVAKWRRARSFVCLVVEAAAAGGGQPSGQLLGTATLSMRQAEAALPPPFPSGAPMRAYISNMAVTPRFRRQGIAKTLVGACGRVARAWGQPAVLLHVAADNTPAQQLYLSCGFAPVPNSQGFSGLIKGPWTQQRMVADPAVMAAAYHHHSSTIKGEQQPISSSFGGAGAGAMRVQPQQWQQPEQAEDQQRQQQLDHPYAYAEDEEEYASSCELLWSRRSTNEDASSSSSSSSSVRV